MKMLKSKDIKHFSTTELFSVSALLMQPRIDTKKNFLETFDGSLVSEDQYKKIREINTGDTLSVDVFQKGGTVKVSSYLDKSNRFVNISNNNVRGKVLDFVNGKVIVQISSIGQAGLHVPAIFERIYCPINSIAKI